MIPAKADPDEQAAYLYEVIQPRLEEAQKGQRADFLLMLRISCWPPSLVFYGRSHGFSSGLPQDGNGSIFWAH